MELMRDKAVEAMEEKAKEKRRKAKEIKLEGELGLYERE